MSATGFVSVPVIPTFAGMSKEFAQKLEAPAKKAGERAGKSMSEPLDGAVTNLEKQVQASGRNLEKLDRTHEKSVSKREQQQGKLEASTLRLEDAENKYKAAVERGDSGLKELARVKDEKARVTKATDDLRQSEIDVTVAEKKHEDQLKDLHETTAKYEMAQADLAAGVNESADSIGGLGDRFVGLKDNMMVGLGKITTGAFLGIGAKIGTSIMSGVQDVMSKGWETALDIDQVSRSLSAMTSETEVAEQMMGDLRAVAGEMPVDYTAFLNAANTLAYMGYEGDEAVKVLENVATAATGAGNDGTEALEAATDALGKMQANGKVTQNEIATISNQGIPMLDMLIEHFGMTEGSYEDLKDKISDGGVELDDVFAALGDTGSGTFQMLSESAENMNQSLDSQMKMLKDDIFVGVGEALQPVLNDLDFESIAESVGDITARLMEFLPHLIDLGLWVADNLHWIAPAAGVLAGIAVAIKLVNLAMAANPIMLVVIAVAALVAGLVYFFTQTELGQEIWGKFTSFLSETWTAVKDTFAEVWNTIKTAVFDAWNETVDGVKSGWESVTGALSGAWQSVSDTFTGTWESIKTFVFDAWNAYVGQVKENWDTVTSALGSAWTWVKDTFSSVWNTIKTAVFDSFNWYIDRVKANWELVTGALNTAWTWVKDTFSSVWETIKTSVFDSFTNVVNGVKSTFDTVTDGISGAWDWLKDTLHTGYLFIKDTVFGGLGTALDTLKGWFQTAVDAVGNIWHGLREAAAKPVRFVVDTVWNNGLLKAVEAVTKFLPGLDAPDPVKIGFRSGGILPGYSRMADGDDQLVPMRRGEGVLVSEGLQDKQSRELFLSANEAAKGGKPFAAFMSDYVAGYAGGGIIGSMQSVMREFYPELSLTSGVRPGDSGYHGSGRAADFSNTGSGMPSTPAMQSAAAFMFGNYGDQLEQLIHHPARNIGSGMDVGDGFGYYGSGTMYGHTDHIHLAALRALVDPSGVVQMMNYDGEGGGGFSILGTVKKLWDAVVSKISPFDGEGNGSWFSQIPGEFLSTAAGKMWEFVTGKIGSGSYDGAGGLSGNVESWREMAMDAMRRNGFNADDPAQVNAMLAQIQSESSGNPSAVQGIIDVNSGGNEAAGLLQVIPGTFAANRDPSLPDDRMDPWANMNAALRYYRGQYGGDLTTMWGHGHGYADGGIVDLSNMLVRDFGGLVPSGAMAVNMSGRDEMMLPPETTALLNRFLSEFPEVAAALESGMVALENAAVSFEKAADSSSVEGITARQTARRVLDLGLDIPGASIMTSFLDSEEALRESRARHLGHLDNLTEKEAALEKARKALLDLESSEDKLSTQDQRKLDDANKAVKKAKDDATKSANQEYKDTEKRADASAKAADKVADAEEKLARVREDLDANATKSAEKHAEEVIKANDEVVKAEQSLIEAKQQQVKDLDHIVLVSQDSIMGLIPQVEGMASQIIGMGIPAAAVNQGLGAVIGSLTSIAGLAGPAGITLGMAFDAAKIVISLIQTIVSFVRDLIAKIRAAHLAAVQAMADGWQVIADYAELVVEMQTNVSTLQQAIVRGLNEQRVAEFQLRVAQQDRLIAEAESSLAVAEARMALDKEIERGNIAAQLRLMGLHEDWDSYLSFQALVANGMLDEWSDAAIGALFTYEAARAQALRAELSARVDQINAEANLAAVTRQNVRNQQDLLKAQERLIRMSAEVAGVDLVDATATSQVAKIIVEMAELQQKMDSSLLGKLGIGAWGNEHRGRQAELDSYRQVLQAIAEETGVAVSDAQIDRAIGQMKNVSWTDGDPMAVLRGIMPELVEAETALRIQDYMGPIWDARDDRDALERDVEDFESEIDLFDRTQPLEETLAGLDYTIAGLEQAAAAWADGNESLRGDYLAAARSQWEAARNMGVGWQLDGDYATPGVRDQITKEVTIHLDGREMYTADQVDQLLAEVASGSNVRVTTKVSASTVANARREGGV